MLKPINITGICDDCLLHFAMTGKAIEIHAMDNEFISKIILDPENLEIVENVKFVKRNTWDDYFVNMKYSGMQFTRKIMSEKMLSGKLMKKYDVIFTDM
jgi:hypothetical protein